ncbi:MAG: hypothetical protein BJ554DRAFT_2655, partial [Olpidium bornovanus]
MQFERHERKQFKISIPRNLFNIDGEVSLLKVGPAPPRRLGPPLPTPPVSRRTAPPRPDTYRCLFSRNEHTPTGKLRATSCPARNGNGRGARLRLPETKKAGSWVMRQGRFAPASARLALLFSATACVFLRPLRTWTTEATQSVIEGAGWTDHPLDYVLDRYPARVAGLPHPPSSGATEVGDEDIVQTLPPARHQKNHCAMYGQCGKLSSSFLARSLPCPTSQRATQPLGSHRDLVVEVCGQDFAETDVCCDEEQLNSLRESVRVAYVLTAACSACWNNFLRFFCEFTCSPDQSTFLNVTSTAVARDTGKLVVNSVDHLVSPTFGAGFFDSCND